jgi:hypothetical protein
MTVTKMTYQRGWVVIFNQFSNVGEERSFQVMDHEFPSTDNLVSEEWLHHSSTI